MNSGHDDAALQNILGSIFKSQLDLSENDELLTIADEEHLELAAYIDNAASNFSINSTIILVPIDKQKTIAQKTEMPTAFTQAIYQSNGIITCLNNRPDCTPFREKIVLHQSQGLSIGHTPGISFSMLADYFPNSPSEVNEMEHRCAYLKLPLATARKCQIITYGSKGTIFSLNIDLGFWERIPIVSNGVIPRGSWGNLLPAETYIAPIEDSAEGDFVINGSFRNKVFNPDEELVLSFAKGRLTQVKGSSEDLADFFFKSTRSVAEEKHDGNWHCLAELGIGVNSRIKRLTGNPVIDEKAANTVHIAIGNNFHMGGEIESVIHFDMVTLEPSIILDNNELMNRGVVDWTSNKWKKRISDISPLQVDSFSSLSISKTEVQLDENAANLTLVMKDGANKVTKFDLGDENLSSIARSILNLVPHENYFQFVVSKTARQLNLTDEEFKIGLAFLLENELIELQ